MKCAVIGEPIAHSLSPQLHRAAYAWLGLDWTYDPHLVGVDQLKRFVAWLGPEWRGLSVTMPCKQAVLSLGRPDQVVAILGVANTVVFNGTPSDVTTTSVHNTDVSGIQMLLRGEGIGPGSDVVILGNGATARSCVYALAGIGVTRVKLRARDPVKTDLLVRDAVGWGIDVTTEDSTAPNLISTVPASVAAEWASDMVGLDLVFDVLYDPWPTPLLALAARRGVPALSGLDLLAAQAVGQVELMTGQFVPFSVLIAAADQAVVRQPGRGGG